jgi:hypothetical protein
MRIGVKKGFPKLKKVSYIKKGLIIILQKQTKQESK